MTNFKRYTKNIVIFFSALRKNRFLFVELVRRDIDQGYRNTLLGKWWYPLTSLVSLAIYTVLFRFIFRLKWSGLGHNSLMDYSLALYSGLIFLTYFLEIANRSTTLLTGNLNYVKKVHFPLEILCTVVTARALYNLGSCLVVLLLFKVLIEGGLHPENLLSLLYLPVLVMFGTGVSLWISSLSLFLPDLQYIVSSLSGLLIFITPVFYSIEMVPISFRWLYRLNPLATYIIELRKSLIMNDIISFPALIVSVLSSLLVLATGRIVFAKLRPSFSDAV